MPRRSDNKMFHNLLTNLFIQMHRFSNKYFSKRLKNTRAELNKIQYNFCVITIFLLP